MRARFLSALFLLFCSTPAIAQSVPTWIYQGSVPTVAQWQQGWASKQDTLGFTPLNKAGDSMNGLLRLAPATSASSGLSIQQGSAPSSPNNGDTWITTAGLFYRANGVTYGPITGTVNCAAMPAFSGAISSTAGTCTTAFSATVPIANGGTGQTSASAALAALGGAPLASPTFTGTPLSTTPGTSDNSTKIATTAFVKAQGYLSACPPAVSGGSIGCMFAPATPPVAHQFITTYNGTAWLSDQPACADISDAVSTCNSLNSPAFTGTPTSPTPLTADNSTKIATTAFVKAQGYVTSASFPVTTVFSRTGDITAQSGDYSFSLISGTASVGQGGTGSGTASGARTNLAVPGLAVANVFTANNTFQNNKLCFQLDCAAVSGTTGILQFDGTNLFTASYVTGGVSHAASISVDSATLATPLSIANGGTGATSASAALAALGAAPLASPAFTGTPTASTPTTSDNTTKLATTAFVKAQAYAPIASPTFTGTASAPTPSTADNTTKIATTAYVQAQGFAPLASPTLTGTPLAPTAAGGTNTTQIATTAFVQTAVSSVTGAVTSVFGRTGAVVSASNDYNFNQLAGTAAVAQGGTGSGTAAGARTNLGVPGLAASNTFAGNQIFSANQICLGFDCTTPGAGNTSGIVQFDGFDTFTLNYKSGALHTAKLSMNALTLATDLTVANGGTGAGTFASNSVLYGNGTSPIQALAVNSTTTHKYLRQFSSGTPSWSQIAFSEISGSITSAQCPAAVSGGTIGCMFAPASPTPVHQFLNSYNGTVWGSAQPDFTDLSGTLASSQFGPLTGDVTTSGYAATIAAIQGTTVSGVTGNGNVVFSQSPVLTGTTLANALTVSTQAIISGNLMLGGPARSAYASAPQYYIDTVSVVDRQYAFKTNGNARWALGVDNATESGANAGSNAYTARYNDAGTLIDKPMTISRASGVVNFADGITQAGNTVLDISSTGTSGAKLPYLNANNMFSGTDAFSSSLTAGADFYWSGKITPTTIAANQNNYAPTGYLTAVTFRLVANSGPFSITGLAGGSEGRVVVFENDGVNDLIISEQNGASSAANRFELGTTNDITLKPNLTMVLKYDSTASLWRWIGGSQIPTPGPAQLGGVNSANCPTGNQWVQGYTNTGAPNCAQPTFGNLASTPTTLSGYGITDGMKTDASNVSNMQTATNNLGHWYKTLSAQQDKTANNTFGGLTDLSITGVAGKTYAFEAVFNTVLDSTNGIRFRMGGTSTATSAGYFVKIDCYATKATDAYVTSSLWASGVAASDTVCTAALVTIKGTVIINAGGTITPQWAQSVTTNPTGISSLLKDGTFFEIHQIN